MKAPRIAVVVPTFEGREVVLVCLEKAMAMREVSFGLFVVDNGSTDGTSDAVRHEFPDARLIRTRSNAGVAGGLNAGLREVLKGKWTHALCLHQDVEPDSWLLRDLLAAAARHPDGAALGPKIHDYWHRDRLLSVGGRAALGSRPVTWRGAGSTDAGSFEGEDRVDCLSGAAMLLPTWALRRVGLFDRQLDRYEDVDWCLRASQAGLACYAVGKAAAWRIVTSGPVERPERMRSAGRSAALLTRRHGDLLAWIRLVLGTFARLGVGGVEALRGRRLLLAEAVGALGGIFARLEPPPKLPQLR